MDFTADIARIQARIAQIFGVSTEPEETAVSLENTPQSGRFAAMVGQAMGPGAANAGTPVAPENVEQLVRANASAFQVDPALVRAIMANESGFDPKATSRTGAQGLMQLMPDTAASLGVSDGYNPEQNVWGGTRYLRGLLDRFNGDVTKAIAAYNAGPEAVEKHGGVPPFAETQTYVKNVLDTYQQYKARP